MQKPDQPDADKPADRLKGLNLDKFGDLQRDTLKGAIRKGTSFFKKAKAALKGDEAAKEELADAAAKAWVKTGDALEQAGKAAGEVIDKADKKIAEARDKKAKPPTP